MPLEMRKNSKWWYGRYKVNNKRYCVNLNVEIGGTPPPSLLEKGDAAFEQSRGKALGALDRLCRDASSKKHSAELIQSLHKSRTGQRIESIEMGKLYSSWKNIPRKRSLSETYINWAGRVFERFISFLSNNEPNAKEMSDISHKTAKDFMAAEATRGISPKTYNAELLLLRSAFKHLRREAGLIDNPFDDIPTKEKNTVHRQPFSQEELTAILETAKTDHFVYPLIVTAMCTAMRRGDVCLLKWRDVDLPNSFITVKTAKTGAEVTIPMLPMLRELLQVLPRGTSEYTFPEQAAMYKTNPDGITWRIKKVLITAGFKNCDDTSNAGRNAILIDIRTKRAVGLYRASIRDFHSFRVTWITMALTAGVPMELVRKVTGHATADVVLKHYFKPGRAEFKKTLESAMPKMLTTSSQLTREERAITLLQSANAKNWSKVASEVIAILSAT